MVALCTCNFSIGKATSKKQVLKNCVYLVIIPFGYFGLSSDKGFCTSSGVCFSYLSPNKNDHYVTHDAVMDE